MKSIKRLEIRSRRIPLASDSSEPYGRAVHQPLDVASIASSLLDGEDQEVFLAFPLDIKNRVLGYIEVARGMVDGCPVHPREVFRSAVMLGASSVILAHNHPSGDPTPSVEDNVLTKRLIEAGKLLGIEILDHVIVSHDSVYSYQEKGNL